MWGEAGPDMDLVPDSAVNHGIVQNESPDAHSRTQKKSLNLLAAFTFTDRMGLLHLVHFF